MKTLFEQDLRVVNVGLQSFAANIAAAGGSVTHLSWSPPAGADAELGWTVANMIGDPRIDEANRTAYERYLAAQPRLVDFLLARDAIPVLAERRILHAGPPISWAEMCGPQKGAICGAILYEGWATTIDAAEKLAASGEVRNGALPCAWRSRADGRHHKPINAGVGGREHCSGEPRLLQC